MKIMNATVVSSKNLYVRIFLFNHVTNPAQAVLSAISVQKTHGLYILNTVLMRTYTSMYTLSSSCSRLRFAAGPTLPVAGSPGIDYGITESP